MCRQRSGLTCIHSANSEILIQARQDDRLAKILRAGVANMADGYWVARAVGAKYGIDAQRIAGSDFFWDLCALAGECSWPLFLLGASTDVLEDAIEIIHSRNPDVVVDGWSPPFFEGVKMPLEIQEEARRRISSQGAKIVVICLGAPKQEIWSDDNTEWLSSEGVRVTLSAGGTLDFVAGRVQRAPALIPKLGFEWLFRLVREPFRIRRQFLRLPRFALTALAEVLAFRAGRT
jgi:N-acetylglucosaminyldiphosphoundecaprenol N-acetyl-beta-D-mannosaminyltransferase